MWQGCNGDFLKGGTAILEGVLCALNERKKTSCWKGLISIILNSGIADQT
jgi:hypothetical protein